MASLKAPPAPGVGLRDVSIDRIIRALSSNSRRTISGSAAHNPAKPSFEILEYMLTDLIKTNPRLTAWWAISGRQTEVRFAFRPQQSQPKRTTRQYCLLILEHDQRIPTLITLFKNLPRSLTTRRF